MNSTFIEKKKKVLPSGVYSIRFAGSELQLHTEKHSLHSDTSRGGHEHTAQCQAEESLQLQSSQTVKFNTLETFTTNIKSRHIGGGETISIHVITA